MTTLPEFLHVEVEATSWPSTPRLALGSSVCALIVLMAALQLRVSPTDSNRHTLSMTQTPERAAENFMAAYGGGQYARAAAFATEPLSARLLTRADHAALPSDAGRNLVIEEIYTLPQEHLRVVGSMVHGDEADSQGRAVSIVVARAGDRFLVESVSFPGSIKTKP